MTGKWFDAGVVSWRNFEALFEHQNDLCRKLRLFGKAGNALKEESLAIEVMMEFLDSKETVLQDLREKALLERDEAGGPGVEVVPRSQEPARDASSIHQKDRAVFVKLLEISKSGGHAWENVRAIIEGTHAALQKNGELSKH